MISSAAALGACSGGPSLPTLDTSVLPVVSNLTVGSINSEPSRHALPSSEVYSRIARGANACWFGPRGRIGKTHLMHADAAPSMNGGAVELVVHERAVDQPKPWGFKAFRVLLTESAGAVGANSGGGGSTEIAVENSRIPDAEAARMRAEVFQWAAGTEGCKADPALDKPAEPEVVAAPPAKAKTARKAVAKSALPGTQAASK